QREENMFAIDFLVGMFVSNGLGVLQGRLSFHGELIRLHTCPWFVSSNLKSSVIIARIFRQSKIGKFRIATEAGQKKKPRRARRGVYFLWLELSVSRAFVPPSRPCEASASPYGVRIGSYAVCPDDPPPV